MNETDTKIGKIKNVIGNKITVLLDENIKSTLSVVNGIVYRVGQIGSFVRVPLGYANLFGVVTQVGVNAIPESMKEKELYEINEVDFSNRWLTVILVGEKIGNKFERGILQFPNSEDEVHLVTIDDLNIIYGSDFKKNAITVGNISVSESLPAKIDIDKFVTRHCSIVGSTGSGKSNSVAVILESIAKSEFKSARVVLIDPHGEYNKSLEEFSKVFKINAVSSKGETELNIPYWALPFNELMKIFPGRLSETNNDYVREKVLEYKLNSLQYLKHKPSETSITADSPIPFSLKHLWFDLYDFEKQTYNVRGDKNSLAIDKKGDVEKFIPNIYKPAGMGSSAPFLNLQAKSIVGYLDAMKGRLIDQRFKFLFEPGGLNPDKDGKIKKDLDDLLKSWLNHDKAITILDLQGIPPEIMSAISGSLLKIIYDGIYWAQDLPVGGRNRPLLIVLEEAHNYLKAGIDSISSRTVQNIAKEGRKFGVGLLLVTQRPSELDETVLSQCGTIIALRMYNQGDKSHVSAAIQDELFEMINLLPSLRTGEALIIGEAVKIPSRVKFYKITNSPKSTDPVVSELWKKPKKETDSFEGAVLLWRNQNFNTKEVKNKQEKKNG